MVTPYQNTYFSASCTIRGSAAVVILPKLALVRIVPGFPGFKWFGRLNASARNSIDWFSRTGNVRVSPIFKVTLPGPRILLLPRFPYVPKAGCANAAALTEIRSRDIRGADGHGTVG